MKTPESFLFDQVLSWLLDLCDDKRQVLVLALSKFWPTHENPSLP